MDKMVAFCGLVCTDCAAYIATKSGDAEAIAKVAADWSAEFKHSLTAEDCWCNGCVAKQGPWMSHCSECEIRACGMGKDLDNCGHCDTYSCDTLTKFFEFVPAAKETLDAVRGKR
jgi:hypothetical protein